VAGAVTVFAPGRVNLIGEHTDYNEGLALPFAIEAGVTVRAVELAESRILATAVDLAETDEFRTADIKPAEGWRAFVRGTAAELQHAGVVLRGAHVEITGTVPRGAGLASSAALGVALAMALSALGADGSPELDRMRLAELCSRVENRWVGARTGLLDQLASLFGEEGNALLIGFRSPAPAPVPLDLGDFRLYVVESGEPHRHAEGGYNTRRFECARACRLLGVDALLDATLDDAALLPAPLPARVRHVISENQRVFEAMAALRALDMRWLARVLNASHASLRDDYDVSTPAVEATLARLREAGAIGARLVGGGFGGSLLALMPPGLAPPAEAVEVRPSAGARVTSRSAAGSRRRRLHNTAP
jgi:galactokinase